MYKPLILVVDDEADLLEIITEKLEKAGFRVEITNEAEHMLEKAKALKPDLILLDINMPGTSGTEAIIDLKSHPELNKIKVAFLTSLPIPWPGAMNEENLARELGAIAYLRKDKDLENIATKIIDILKK